MKWWTKESRAKGSEKTGTKLTLIKTRLNAKFVHKIGNKLIRRLSEIKISNKDDELVKYRLGFSVGDTNNSGEGPKSSAHAHVKFGVVDKQKLLDCGSAAEIILPFKEGVSESVVADESKKFIELFSKFPLPNKVTVDTKERVVRVNVAVPGAPDPFMLASSLGIDLSSYVKECSLDLKFKNALEEIINTTDTVTTVADLLEFSYELKIQIRKALLHTIGQTVPGRNSDKIAILAMLENFNISVALGTLKAFLTALNPPTGVHSNLNLPREYNAFVIPAQNFAKMAVDPKTKQLLKDAYLKTVSGNEQGLTFLTTAKNFLEGVSQVNVFTESGVMLSLELKNLIMFKLVPTKV